MVTKIPIKPKYKKDNGLWNLDTLSLPLPGGFAVKERNLVYIPADEFGGNHKHPRTEVFVGIGGNLFIVWQDAAGEKHEDKMMDDDQLYMFIVEPLTPHAVINKGSGFSVLLELADGPNIGVEQVAVLEK